MTGPRHGERAVVDASAVLTLVLDPTERGNAVAASLRRSSLYAPDVLPYEVANVLRRRRHSGLLSEGESRLARSSFASLPVELWPFAVLSDRAWQLGANLSAYDAAYVALAERLDATLITSDARLAAAPGLRCAVDVVGA